MRRGSAKPGALGALLVSVGLLTLGACQNWDLLQPPEQEGGGERAFTRLGEAAASPLTSEIAVRRLEAIESARGVERLELVEAFLGEFPVANRIPEVHRFAGEARLAGGDAAAAVESFERALALTRTDVLGVPLEVDLLLQLGMARLEAGRVEEGLDALGRAHLADHGPRVEQALRFAHAEHATEGLEFETWLAAIKEPLLVQAPSFELPGYQQETVSLAEKAGKATLINFWSPT